MSKNLDTYQEMGYGSREDYLRELAKENGADPAVVFAIADILGPGEDFDALVSSVEDWFWNAD